MNKQFFTLVAAVLMVVFNTSPGQSQKPVETTTAPTGGTKFLSVSEVKPGMRGVAMTVFRGSKPEEFSVEILGVIPGAIGPQQDLIIGRLSGGGADRTSVFAGMSGSPVYVDGKLVGAISYSFPFAKEPICGITPIEQMIDLFEQKPAREAAAPAAAISLSELSSAEWRPQLPPRTVDSGLLSGFSQASLSAAAGQSFRPIATPVTFNGISQAALDAFAPQLLGAGLMPVAAVGGSAAITPLKVADATTLLGGASVSMQLARGDYSMAAAGTVTLRDGNKIYAFGHPFLSLGVSDLPMSESSVVTVVPNLSNSFKLAVPEAMVGSMTQDRATGVFGTLGIAPKMIPIQINLRTSRGAARTLNMEIVSDDFLTPLLLNIAVYNALLSQERGVGNSTISMSGRIELAGQQPVRIERRFAGSQAAQLAAAAVAAPLSLLIRSKFEELSIKGLKINLTSVDGSSPAVLDRIAADKMRLRAGETSSVQIFGRTAAGQSYARRLAFTVPEGTPSGPLTLTIGDGSALQQSSSVQQLVPANLGELVDIFNKFKPADQMYLQLSRTSPGAIVGSSEMPNLPPSVLATLNNDRTAGGVKSLLRTTVSETALEPAEFIVTGQQSITLEIID